MARKGIEQVLDTVKSRYNELPANSPARKYIEAQLRSLARYQKEPFDYKPAPTPRFPEAVQVVHAVCHPECGSEAFLLDGGPQNCPKCGGTLLRDSGAEYGRLERR